MENTLREHLGMRVTRYMLNRKHGKEKSPLAGLLSDRHRVIPFFEIAKRKKPHPKMGLFLNLALRLKT
ncbi:hypothetical protein [Vibrio parahaemolyticus]|uniref:hypothetical protein n=3 Tax=Vibrio parahaemolyticus TaxID=670 RepID=UPI00137613BF|nr:hypothetical protein [Vibrio parahaemolyticus]MBM5152100.1 hypothetical protein [Vibrio parahaemolyticus]MBM5152120.1 hypothetical protein [Vibrio parahaemolyticus]MBM5152130.1 hypothetical protein [Vibrio parahaemolyticus]MBM5152182.1 hypothetical protein [Vibrio parahaemolyticus]MBM5152189.1 hypothetical protein [Vibrio parahaemolyticus]